LVAAIVPASRAAIKLYPGGLDFRRGSGEGRVMKSGDE
jgi:hypothetical protein